LGIGKSCDSLKVFAVDRQNKNWLLNAQRYQISITQWCLKQGGIFIMTPVKYSRLITFLQEDLAISPAFIAVAERAGGNQSSNGKQDPNSLPIILWQYGLVTLEQLDKIFDWLARA
jgi:hypothetical protein